MPLQNLLQQCLDVDDDLRGAEASVKHPDLGPRRWKRVDLSIISGEIGDILMGLNRGFILKNPRHMGMWMDVGIFQRDIVDMGRESLFYGHF